MLKSYGRGVLSSLIKDMLDHFKKNSSFIKISFGFDLLFPHYMFSSVQVFYYVFLSACKTTQNINYICFFALITLATLASPHLHEKICNLIGWEEYNIGRICTLFTIFVLFP